MIRLLRPLARSGAVLCYHGIARDASADSIHVPLHEVATAVRIAREIGEVVPLTELVRRHVAGRSTAGLFAVTFDDAYVSLQAAADFFTRERVPATVFAIPAALDDGRTFWWDRLSALLQRLSAEEVAQLCDRLGIPDDFRSRQGDAWGPGRALRQWVIARHAARWPEEFEQPLHDLELAHGTRPADRSMTWQEFDVFMRDAPVDIGVHTSTHPALPKLTPAEQRSEIAMGFERLRERIPATVPILAAPFGLYDANTVRATRAVGLDACLSLGARTLRYAGATGAVPRFCMMRSESQFKLALRLSGVIDRLRDWRGERPVDFPIPPSLVALPKM